MKDVYLHPTIHDLGTALPEQTPAAAETRIPAANEAAANEAAAPVSTPRYLLCGALQLLLFLGSVCLGAFALVTGFGWVRAGDGVVDTWVRSLGFSVASFLVLCTVPIVAKWGLVGRWKPQHIPVWSLAYVRFWVVKTLIRSNPLVLFVGSPLYVLYLRALGAKIGRGVAIFSHQIPVCTDLLTIGDGTVIREDTSFACYRAHASRIQTGTVTLGKNVVVGEEAVIDIHTSMGDEAQLGHASSLHPSQAVPDGQRWHGSPPQRTSTDFRTVAPARCGTLRRILYTLVQLLLGPVLAAPLGIVLIATLLTEVRMLADVFGPGHSLTSWTFYRDALILSLLLFFGGVLVGLAFVITVPRLLNLAIKPDRVYPLYGFHYWIQRTITGITNSKFYMRLFGDSSAIVYFLRTLGYDLSRIEQTGSNFGNELKQDNPHLSSVGTGTMLSDGVSVRNAEFSSTSFRVSGASLGARSFFGNNIAYPAQGKTGDNCLLATKVMIPIEGQLREDVGLLGSPPFEIPRSVQHDGVSDHPRSGEELRRRLAAKNKYNAATMGWYLLVRWIHFFAVTLLVLIAVDLYHLSSVAVISSATVLTLAFTVIHAVLIERLVAGFRPLRPQFCSIYEPYYWWHERLWKTEASALFSGTPFKNVIWRLLGIRIGRRVFDDGCYIPEKTLVAIGDDCTLNENSVIQCHSQEEGTFKSDGTTIGAGCTVGINGFVHYGVTIGDGAVLEANSFLMKGEEITPHTRWGGNPATQVSGG